MKIQRLILRLILDFEDNTLCKSTIVTENESHSLLCPVELRKEFSMVYDLLNGKYDHLIALEEGTKKKSLTRKTSGKSGNIGRNK